MSESAGIDSFFGASDAEALFRRLACPSDCRCGDRCLAARGGRTLWNQPQRGGDLGAAFDKTASVTAKPSGGGTSPLEQHAEFLLGLIVDQPDLTLHEIVAAMRKRRIAGSRSAVWRFFARRNISFKKNSVRGGAEACGRSPRSPALDARARHV